MTSQEGKQGMETFDLKWFRAGVHIYILLQVRENKQHLSTRLGLEIMTFHKCSRRWSDFLPDIRSGKQNVLYQTD